MGMEHERDDDTPALPAWVEAELAERREFWAALRDGGATTPAEELESIWREIAGAEPTP